MRLFICLLFVCLLALGACSNKKSGDGRQASYSPNVEYDSLRGKSLFLSAHKMVSAYNGRIISNKQRDDFYQGKTYRFVLYFGSENCSACTLQQFYRWDEMMDFVGREQVEYFYVLRPDENSEINQLVDALNKFFFSLPVLFDEQGLFEEENAGLGLCGTSAGFFTDCDGKILLAGNPAADEGQFADAVRRIVNQLIE